MSEKYIQNYFPDIEQYANVIEARLCDLCTSEEVLEDNQNTLMLAGKHVLIDDTYEINLEIQ